MRLLSVSVWTIASLLSAVRADYWYAFYTDSAGFSFMDSNDAKITATTADSVAAVDANHDKGQRFKFEEVTSFVASQAHSNHWVGFDEGAQEFHADFAKDHYDALVKINMNGTHCTLCQGNNCIGPGGSVSTTPFLWKYSKVSEA